MTTTNPPCEAHDPNTDDDCGRPAVAIIAHVDAPNAAFHVCDQCLADAMWVDDFRDVTHSEPIRAEIAR